MIPLSTLLSLFFAFSLGFGVVALIGRDIVTSYQTAITELFERFFSDQFMTVNANQMVAAYFFALLAFPTVLYWVGFPWFIAGVSIIVVLLTPYLAVKVMEGLRRKQIVNSLPDALQQIGAALRAGSTFNTALDSLVSEQEGPLSQEFSLVLREQRLGIGLDVSLEDLGDRVKSEDMDITVSAILIAQDVGGNLAEVLTRLADTLRAKISMEERIRSLTAQGVMQGYVVTALPSFIVLALLLLERESMLPLFTSLLGWVFIAVILTLQTCGGWFIRKIVSIDI